MAFQTNAQRSNSFNRGRNNEADSNNDQWKASGFLNLYLPNKDGKLTKLGAIALSEGRAKEKQMLDWLTADPTRVQIILSKLKIEFRTSEPTEGSQFDLSDPAPAEGNKTPSPF